VRALAFGGNRYAYIVQGLFSDAELLQFATHKVPPTGLTEAIVHEVMLGIHWPQLEKCRNFIVGQRLSIEHNSVYGLIEIIV
ncbi:MAG: hypothetical protein N3A57_07365, partial [Negativicutes bacterium]|nr:hypothetical protein [Negativicutes bacterium]